MQTVILPKKKKKRKKERKKKKKGEVYSAVYAKTCYGKRKKHFQKFAVQIFPGLKATDNIP
jgi:hypothetical protein